MHPSYGRHVADLTANGGELAWSIDRLGLGGQRARVRLS